MASTTYLGPGLVSVGDTQTVLDFTCEVLGAKITHGYEDVGQARTMLCGTVKPAGQTRVDGFSAEVENDLTAAGLYAFLVANDGQQVPFAFTPRTGGASWEGTIVARLPSEVGADEFGAPIVSSIEWAAVGLLDVTPAPESFDAGPSVPTA